MRGVEGVATDVLRQDDALDSIGSCAVISDELTSPEPPESPSGHCIHLDRSRRVEVPQGVVGGGGEHAPRTTGVDEPRSQPGEVDLVGCAIRLFEAPVGVVDRAWGSGCNLDRYPPAVAVECLSRRVGLFGAWFRADDRCLTPARSSALVGVCARRPSCGAVQTTR